jgi:cell division inhibitor SulA/protein ImuA
MLLAPPYIPYAPALESHGCDLSRLLVVHSKRHMDTLWAMEQALRSGSCAAVVAWSRVDDDRALRRLQLAAEETGCWAVLFRVACCQPARSPAALRLRLLRTDARDGLSLQILKQRNGRPAVVRVDL